MTNDTELALYKILTIALTDCEDYGLSDNIDWKRLFRLATGQGVIAIVTDGIQKIIETADNKQKDTLPQQKKNNLYNAIGQAITIENTCRSQYVSAIKLSKLWKENGIRTMVLKGIAFGSYYPNPIHRPCNDMDCYLCGKYDEGNGVIERLGINVNKEDYRHATFFYENLHVENHKICTTVRGRKQRKVFEKYLRDLLEKEPTTLIPESGLEIPCPLFNALYFLQHAHRHFLREGITLRYVCDWAMIVDKCSTKIDWLEFKVVAEQNDILSFAESMTRLAYFVCGIKCNELVKDYNIQSQDRMMLDDCYAIAQNAIKYGNRFKAHCQMVNNMISQRWKYKYFSDHSFIEEIILSVYGVFFEKEPNIDS